jgi:hypothetical protein
MRALRPNTGFQLTASRQDRGVFSVWNRARMLYHWGAKRQLNPDRWAGVIRMLCQNREQLSACICVITMGMPYRGDRVGAVAIGLSTSRRTSMCRGERKADIEASK